MITHSISCIQGSIVKLHANDRAIMASMTRDQWPNYMKEVYRILKPGTGWIQCGEFNPFFQCDDGSVPDTADIWTVLEIYGLR